MCETDRPHVRLRTLQPFRAECRRPPVNRGVALYFGRRFKWHFGSQLSADLTRSTSVLSTLTRA